MDYLCILLTLSKIFHLMDLNIKFSNYSIHQYFIISFLFLILFKILFIIKITLFVNLNNFFFNNFIIIYLNLHTYSFF